MNERNSFYFRVIMNWLKANLILHMRELKEDKGKTKTKQFVASQRLLDYFAIQ